MARRRKKGTLRHTSYLVAPLLTLAVIPLYLHSSGPSLVRATDDWMQAVFALLLTIVSISGFGAAVDYYCVCGDRFALILLVVQILILAVPIIFWSMMPGAGRESSAGLDVNKNADGLPSTMSKTVASHTIRSFNGEAMPAFPEQPQSGGLSDSELDSSTSTSTSNLIELPAKLSEVPGWRFVGDGYCEEQSSHQEFSSLHANGKSLKECAEVGSSKAASVAFDFSSGDGGCDIRYAAGASAQSHPGFSWWGWGAGLSSPVGSGKQKHDLPTVCYAKLQRSTRSPAASQVALNGWRGVGKGHCEDGWSHAEFSSLQVSGKTLQECAVIGSRHAESIAFDFTADDGGCDIRFPVGAYTPMEPGYTFWGFGDGRGNPVGSGKPKHDLPTDCYAKVIENRRQAGGAAPQSTPVPSPVELEALLSRGKGRFSIVLACASEGLYMVKTVQSFCDKTPSEILQEIIVVDDGSDPPLSGLLNEIETRCRLRVFRHEETKGLMIAKQTGGDAATGEYIGFFDCHVSPGKGWHQELLQVLTQGPRRLAVPLITDLDIDTWEERPASQMNSKCYIDFNAEFMWFENPSDYIPVISGGLVALSRSWWLESGGFDSKMRGWGGENVDQSLRTWLCGGEILRAKSSRIAHMWRVPADSRTKARYRPVTGVNNIARVAASWFDKYTGKYHNGMIEHGGAPDVSNVLALKKKLNCKPFTYFLHRFRSIYENGGLLPAEVFKLKSGGSGRCVRRQSDRYTMGPCTQGTWFHLANQKSDRGGKCCAGIRQWNAMECFDRLDTGGPLPYYCDITGKNDNQKYDWGEDGGIISHPYSGHCLTEDADGDGLVPGPCEKAVKWNRHEKFVPVETSIYKTEVVSLGLTSDGPDI